MDLYLDSCGNDSGEVAGMCGECQQQRRCNDRGTPVADPLCAFYLAPELSRRLSARWSTQGAIVAQFLMGGLQLLPFLILGPQSCCLNRPLNLFPAHLV